MIRRPITALLRRARAALPEPMAAPETAYLRGKWMRFVMLLSFFGAVTSIWALLAAISQFGATLLWLSLALATLLDGVTWLISKHRADEAWLDAVSLEAGAIDAAVLNEPFKP